MARGRKNKGNDEENTERWMVSYADFITLLFAFFVVMYSLSSINEGKYRVLSNSLIQAFRPNEVTIEESRDIVPPVVIVQPKPGPLAAAESARQAVKNRMRNMADAIRRVLQPLTRSGQVSVAEGANGVTVEINASALFTPGEAVLDRDASAALKAVAGVLAEVDFPIKVEGHTDNLPISNQRFPSNWELSSVRASSVVRLFIEAGVAPERLTAAGYADQHPVAENDTEANRARNRRVAIMIESNLAGPEPEAQEPAEAPESDSLSPDDPISTILPATPPPAFDQIEIR